ncbi:hypothetical protein HON52_03885 [Candidatus Uhrbacteria bacterium]|nr:hypothetical protein [Candidatus Uhrbacteria bacterium]
MQLATATTALGVATTQAGVHSASLARAQVSLIEAHATGDATRIAALEAQMELDAQMLAQAEARAAEASRAIQNYKTGLAAGANTLISVMLSIGNWDMWQSAMHPEYGFDTMGPQGASNGYGDSTGGGGQSAFWDWIDSLGGGGWGKGKTDPCDDGTWKPSDPAWDNEDFCATGITAESESRYSLTHRAMAEMARYMGQPVYLNGYGYMYLGGDDYGIIDRFGNWAMITMLPTPEYEGVVNYFTDVDGIPVLDISVVPMTPFFEVMEHGNF